ncbi:MAG: carboxypeptidase-like regulatory domain-containing protein [Acidobacteriia bacterium]|nr:carboxypeptidase-like regulatory domain-containing protein [Terriglobia bacterium]
MITRPAPFFKAWLWLLLILVNVGPIAAQTTGTLRGQVLDLSGATVPAAHVVATVSGTNLTREATTAIDGDFVLPALAVGRYELAIDAPGFKQYIQRDVEITLGHVTLVEAVLELGLMTQVVTAVAESPLIETTSTQIGAVVGNRAVVNLPLNTRDTYQLLQLQPGVQSQTGIDTGLIAPGWFPSMEAVAAPTTSA